MPTPVPADVAVPELGFVAYCHRLVLDVNETPQRIGRCVLERDHDEECATDWLDAAPLAIIVEANVGALHVQVGGEISKVSGEVAAMITSTLHAAFEAGGFPEPIVVLTEQPVTALTDGVLVAMAEELARRTGTAIVDRAPLEEVRARLAGMVADPIGDVVLDESWEGTTAWAALRLDEILGGETVADVPGSPPTQPQRGLEPVPGPDAAVEALRACADALDALPASLRRQSLWALLGANTGSKVVETSTLREEADWIERGIASAREIAGRLRG